MLNKITNIVLIFTLLIAFIGILVTKSICNMDFCAKECAMDCCKKDKTQNDPCEQKVEYTKLDSDLSITDVSIKIPDISLVQTILLLSTINPIALLKIRHGEFIYYTPLTTIDIPVRVRCFRI